MSCIFSSGILLLIPGLHVQRKKTLGLGPLFSCSKPNVQNLQRIPNKKNSSKRLRAFKRWMTSQGIECSNEALEFIDTPEDGMSVKALWDLNAGDLIAKYQKLCLTIKTSGAADLIKSAGLDGYSGPSVVLMYEKSLGWHSSWVGYLQVLPDSECLPVVWSLDEVDQLLHSAELHKANFKIINGLVLGLVIITWVAPNSKSLG